MAHPEDDLDALLQANHVLRQSLEQMADVVSRALAFANSPGIEQIFQGIADAVASALPALALEGVFRRPTSPTIYQLRHRYTEKELSPLSEKALDWARERRIRTMIPLETGGVFFCPLVRHREDLGYLLVHIDDSPDSVDESTGMLLDLISEHATTAIFHLWNRMALEEQIRQSGAQADLLGRILATHPGMVIALDPAGRLLYANREASRVFGRSLDTLVGQHYQVIFPAEVTDTLSDHFLHVQKGKGQEKSHVRFANFKGEVRTLALQARALTLQSSHGTGLLLTTTAA